MVVAHAFLMAALLPAASAPLPGRGAVAASSRRAGDRTREERLAEARSLVWRTRYAEAEEAYRGLLRERPGDAEAETGLARVLLRVGRFEEAEASARDVLARWPDDLEAHLVLGDLLLRTARPDEALREYEAAAGIDADEPRARAGRARALAARGLEDEARAADVETVRAMRRRTGADPDDLDGRLALAAALLRIGEPGPALAQYEEALRRAPDDVEAGLGRVRAEVRLERLEAALEHVDCLIADHPDCAEAFGLRGAILHRLGDPREAERAFARAVELDPWNPEHRLGIARSRWARGDVAGARAASAGAEALDAGDRDVRELVAKLDAVREEPRFRFSTLLRGDRLSGDRDDWSQEGFRLGWRATEDLELGAGADFYQRYGEDDAQVTLDGVWRFAEPWCVSAAVVSGGDAEVVAREAYEVEFARRVARSASAYLRYRHSSFAGGIRSDLVSPGLEVAIGSESTLVGRLYFVDGSSGTGGIAGSLRMSWFPERSVGPRVGVAYGNEAFLARTVQETTSDADVLTLSAGAEWRCSARTRLSLDLDYEWHESLYEKVGLALGLTVGF